MAVAIGETFQQTPCDQAPAGQNASAGQQATVLLITLLNQPGPPLVIDQPEDDFDNQIIFEIVKRVGRAKTRRQLIFSSHNANLDETGKQTGDHA